ncbi:hypothetical protein OSTOST_01683, partial [Ostertagia ostertagi]
MCTFQETRKVKAGRDRSKLNKTNRHSCKMHTGDQVFLEGVGIIVKRRVVPLIVSCEIRSPRVAILLLKVGRKRTNEDYTDITFLNINRLRIMNTFFMKPEKRLWTWKSPNGTVKKQIDYVFSNVQRIFQDVSVIGENIIATNSDHRMIRSTIIIDNALESRILARSRRIGSKVISNPEEVEEQLKREDLNYLRLVTIDDDYQKLFQSIKEAVEAGSTRGRRQNHRLSERTLQLLRRRAALKAQGILDEEYHHICEQARRMIVADYDNYRTRKLREAVKANKGLKKITKEVQLKQKIPLALKDESGSRVFTRSGMTRICKSFFNKLYSSVILIQEERCAIQPEKFQPVLTDEVEAAIAKLKNGKCPGIDGITAEMLKAGGTTLAKLLARRFT